MTAARTAGRAVQLCPSLAICPGCARPELVGAGETEWVCHGQVIQIVFAFDGVDELGPLLEPAA